MSNFFGTGPAKPESSFQVNNGGTAVMLSVLVLAGSALADTPGQVRHVIWLAGRDQGVLGLGLVGFDVCDMPWELDAFEADRAFLRAVVAAAQAGAGWERLAYAPARDFVGKSLAAFAGLLDALAPADVPWDAMRPPRIDWPTAIIRCPRHDVYEHAAGCLLCNDEG